MSWDFIPRGFFFSFSIKRLKLFKFFLSHCEKHSKSVFTNFRFMWGSPSLWASVPVAFSLFWRDPFLGACGILFLLIKLFFVEIPHSLFRDFFFAPYLRGQISPCFPPRLLTMDFIFQRLGRHLPIDFQDLCQHIKDFFIIYVRISGFF